MKNLTIEQLAVVFTVSVLTTWSILKLGMRRRNRYVALISAVTDLYRKGDFEAALQATEGLNVQGKEANYLYYRGDTLRELGRLDEAEEVLKRAVAVSEQEQMEVHGRTIRDGVLRMKQLVRLFAFANQSLAGVYLLQGRYDDAIKALEVSLRERPNRGSAQRQLGEVYLRMGKTAEALEWCQRAVETERAGPIESRELHEMHLAEELATLAWAVAVARSDQSQVEKLVTEADQLAAHKPVMFFGRVNLHVGFAYEALGNPQEAIRRLTAAASSDTHGAAGRLATARLAQLQAA